MKKALFIFVLTCTVTLLHAQPYRTRAYIYAEGGVNLASLYQSSNNSIETLTSVWGPEANIYVRAKFPNQFGFDAGVGFSVKGANFSGLDALTYLNYATAYSDGLIYFYVANNSDFYFGGGAFIGYAINGKAKYSTGDEKIQFGDTWKRFDVGMQVKTVYDYNNLISVGLNYSLGFLPAYRTTDRTGQPNNGRNSVISATIGIKLAKIFDKDTWK